MKPRVPCVLKSNLVLIIDFKKPILNSSIKFNTMTNDSMKSSSKLLLREIMELYFGGSEEELTIERNWYGKPFLTDRENAWFNLSHSGSVMALVLSRTGEVGVDIEFRTIQKDYAKIAHRFFHCEEVSALNLLPPQRAQRQSHMLWCLKEAYIKAIGKGLTQPLNSFRFNIGRHHVDLYEPQQNSISQCWQCQYHELSQDYGLAVCVPRGKPIDFFCLNTNKQFIPKNNY